MLSKTGLGTAEEFGNVVLKEGGFKKQISGFNVERIGNAARALAFGRYAFNKARDHVAELVMKLGDTHRPQRDFAPAPVCGFSDHRVSDEIQHDLDPGGVRNERRRQPARVHIKGRVP